MFFWVAVSESPDIHLHPAMAQSLPQMVLFYSFLRLSNMPLLIPTGSFQTVGLLFTIHKVLQARATGSPCPPHLLHPHTPYSTQRTVTLAVSWSQLLLACEGQLLNFQKICKVVVKHSRYKKLNDMSLKLNKLDSNTKVIYTPNIIPSYFIL